MRRPSKARAKARLGSTVVAVLHHLTLATSWADQIAAMKTGRVLAFGNPTAAIGLGPAYLQTNHMLNSALGGLNSLFQQGGPRSLQISLKLGF